MILRLFSFGHSCNMWIIVSWACWLHWLHIGGGSFLRRCSCVSRVWPILSLAIIISSFLVFWDEVCHLHVSSFIFFSLLLLSGTDLQNSFHFSLILFLLCCLRSLHSIISLTCWSCLVSFASLSACSFPGICLWLGIHVIFMLYSFAFSRRSKSIMFLTRSFLIFECRNYAHWICVYEYVFG